MRNKSLKLAILLPALYGGGAERTMLKLAGGMTQRGITVDFVLARAEGPLLAEVPDGVRVLDLKSKRTITSLPSMVQYLKRERPDVLLSGLHANLIALWSKRLSRIPIRVVVSERNMLSSKSKHYASSLRMRWMPGLARRFYPWADELVAVSRGVADDLAKETGIRSERIRVIYNPVVTPEMQEGSRSPLRHPWFEPGEPPVILAAGRLTAQKDYPTLIAAFDRVVKVRRAHLMILGEGEERAALEGQVRRLGLERDINLPGFAPNPTPYMRRAAVFVLSSRWEGLPGALIEALYCGSPLVSTDCQSGPREILAGGEYGRLVPVGDVNLLAEAILVSLETKPSPPPEESWRPFELGFVLDQYAKLLFK